MTGTTPDVRLVRVRLADNVLRDFPDAAVAGVLVDRLDNSVAADTPPFRPIPAIDDPVPGRLEAWQAAYRSLGVNPRRNRPSAEALRRQIERKGGLASINPVVDLYNDVSVRHCIPVGGYDAHCIDGDIVLTRGVGGETFAPLPAGSPVEFVEPGEIIYRDARRVLTRRWNFRDSAETAIGVGTTAVLLLAETPSAEILPATLDQVVADLVSGLERRGGRTLATFALSTVQRLAEVVG